MNKKVLSQIIGGLFISVTTQVIQADELNYSIVDTVQKRCFDTKDVLAKCPLVGKSMHGQDAQYIGLTPSYQKNSDGTVLDKNTGLIWISSIDHNNDGVSNAKDKMSYEKAVAFASKSRIGGFDDWRVPSIKELYSIFLFDGEDVSPLRTKGTYYITPYMDQNYFDFAPGDTKNRERLIDSQYLSSTKYVSTTMPSQDETVFGVNFIDGRIKGYGMQLHNSDKTFYVMLVRGNTQYGENKFVTNNNATITDRATGFTWQEKDSQTPMNWPDALGYCENLTLAGNNEWRLPNLKELQSIVDYSRSPATSNSAAISPLFQSTELINEGGQKDYGAYWSSNTHIAAKDASNEESPMAGEYGEAGGYIAFGRSLGYMGKQWTDVHGAGSQRSDPKTGDASQFPTGRGPQGDVIRINNFVRCVTGGVTKVVQPNYKMREKVEIILTGKERTPGGPPPPRKK